MTKRIQIFAMLAACSLACSGQVHGTAVLMVATPEIVMISSDSRSVADLDLSDPTDTACKVHIGSGGIVVSSGYYFADADLLESAGVQAAIETQKNMEEAHLTQVGAIDILRSRWESGLLASQYAAHGKDVDSREILNNIFFAVRTSQGELVRGNFTIRHSKLKLWTTDQPLETPDRKLNRVNASGYGATLLSEINYQTTARGTRLKYIRDGLFTARTVEGVRKWSERFMDEAKKEFKGSVGGDVDIAVLDSHGPRWLKHKPNCR